MLFTKQTKHITKYYLVTAEPPATVKTIDCVHQTGPRKGHSILQYVVFKLVYQVCHCVGRCVKMGVQVLQCKPLKVLSPELRPNNSPELNSVVTVRFTESYGSINMSCK